MSDPDHLSDFQEGQWWIAALDAASRVSSDDDLKRAVAVVHHMLRSSAALLAREAELRSELDSKVAAIIVQRGTIDRRTAQRDAALAREAALRGALTLSLQALESCSPADYSTGHVIHPSCDAALCDRAEQAARAALASATEVRRDQRLHRG